MQNKISTCVILAGGLGSRISEETESKPKPMVLIGNIPIIHHIMNHYSKYGIHNFIICAGYKSESIKKYFLDLFNLPDIIDINYRKNVITNTNLIKKEFAKWKVQIIDTGVNSNTGWRIKKVEKYIEESNFHLTYGDGLSNVNLERLTYQHHKSSKSLVTISAVKSSDRFGSLVIDKKDMVSKFVEKNNKNEKFINGGFQIVNKKALDSIKSSKCSWEFDILEKLSKKKQLGCFQHEGFWQCMDNLREKKLLENLWLSKKAPWL